MFSAYPATDAVGGYVVVLNAALADVTNDALDGSPRGMNLNIINHLRKYKFL